MTPIIEKMGRFFDRQGMPVSIVGRAGEAIRITRDFPGCDSPVTVLIITDDEDIQSNQVQVKMLGLFKASPDSPEIFRKLNELNQRFRWFKLTMDEEGSVDLTSDILVNAAKPENEIFELLTLGLKICEVALPELK